MPTLIFEDKFTTGGTWNTSSGTPTIVDTPVPPSGGKALEVNNTNEYVFWNIPDSGYTRIVLGVWFRATAWPGTETRVFKVDAGPSEGWALYRNNGEWAARADGTPTITQFFQSTVLAVDTWRWMQVMYDVGSNPWELRFKNGSAAAVNGTGAATATNLNPGILLLGTTSVGSVLTRYYGHFLAGVAANDDDWWPEPAVPGRRTFKRLYGPAQLTTSAASIYTVPTGVRTTIRHMFCSNPSGSTVDFTWSIGADAAATRLYTTKDIAAGDALNENLDHTLEAGETIQAYSSVATTVLMIDGYEESL